VRHVLVTNDFPPKVGGIQHYLGELYRRIDPTTYAVVTTAYPGAQVDDARRGARVVRMRGRLLPTAALARTVRALVAELDADCVVIDPLWPLGRVGARVGVPWIGVAHGAEVTLPLRLPGVAASVAATMGSAAGVIAAGRFVGRALEAVVAPDRIAVVPPGVDLATFRPDAAGRAGHRAELMVDPRRRLVLFVSRLVPRKGAHIAIDALGDRAEAVELHVVGDGRARAALEHRARRRGLLAVFAGRVERRQLVRYYQAADLLVFPAHDRWAGLEQEGFGIVVLEAQACGVPVVAGVSGGTPEAVDPASGVLVAGTGRGAWSRALADALRGARVPDPRPRAFVAEHYDYDALAVRWVGAIGALAGRGPIRASGYPRAGGG